METTQCLLRQLPAIDRLLNDPALQQLDGPLPHVLVREAAQLTIERLRRQILDFPEQAGQLDLSVPAVAALAVVRAEQLAQPSLRPVINATGTLLHTNLGRAPLCDRALTAVTEVSRGYSNLEFDLTSGERGQRYSHVEGLICRLTGAEAATVVNNNAGAVLLALTALAKGKEAIVSRGEMIEIGGSFRVPEVMAAGGVILRETGTTNKTHLQDYRQAINPQTGLLLKIHTSNYRIVGFTEAVSTGELVQLGAKHKLPILEDLGSGMLMDLTSYGLPKEPTVRETVAAGADVVTFSGDKLLGGPQAGLIVGRQTAIDAIRKHPMARALRIDKMTLAALEATLQLYLDQHQALREIPVLQMLQISPEELQPRCRELEATLQNRLGDRITTEIISENSMVGGGALPLAELPGYAVAIKAAQLSTDQLALRLRAAEPPLIGRIQDDRLLLNPRTFSEREVPALLRALSNALNGAAS
ncbi:MAG TPA: L-seryl-tRNA(Sec) selenium transferase [Geothermobacteraceae bacterium]|nr:L-seryl-tRNA(Sec) selenium transferase [Geothermobacteraceae bacterium]